MNPINNTTPAPENNVYQTGQNAVPGGGDYGGWVSGDPSSLAPSAQVDCVFDLGPAWRRINFVGICVSPTGTSSGITCVPSGNDTATYSSARRLNASSANASGGLVTMTGTAFNWNVKPMGRYLILRITNSDATNPQGAGTNATICTYTN